MSYTKSQAQSGKGSVFSIGVQGTSSITWTQIGEVTSSSFSGTSAEVQEVTNFNSGSYREQIPTILSPGNVKLVGNRVSSDAGQTLLYSTFSSLAVVPFQLTLPKTANQVSTGDTMTFNALVQSQDFTVDVSKIVTFDITLLISGPITTVAGA